MKKVVFFVAIIFSLQGLCGQSLELGFQLGQGQYKMDNLTTLLHRTDVPLDEQIVHDYPPYLYYQPELVFTNDTLTIGLCYAFHSTGSRVSVKDYSGEYRMDTKVKSSSLGILFKGRVFYRRGIGLRLYGESGPVWNTLFVEEFFEFLGNENFKDDITFKSLAFYLEPGVALAYSYGRFSVSANLGYYWQFYSKPLKEVESEYSINVPLSQEDGRADWSGLRYGITIGIKIL